MEKVIELLHQRMREHRQSDRPLCAFVYDLEHLRRHAARRIDSLPPSCRLFYAVKANSSRPILEALAGIVHGFEVASLGEIEKVRAVDPDIPIIFGGPGKTREEIEGAMRHNVSLIHVESEHELHKVAHIAAARGIQMPVLLRVNLRGPLPQATLAMAGRPTQFGIDEARLPDVIRIARQYESVRIEGFQLHSISNNLDHGQHLHLIGTYLDRLTGWIEQFGLTVTCLNVGGGIGVNYADLGRQFRWNDFAARLGPLLAAKCPPGVTVVFECGRYLTASCGYYAAEVIDLKENHGKKYAVIRGGTHHFRLPASWQHSHPFRIIPREEWAYPYPRTEWTDAAISVVGQLCTPKDVLAQDVSVPRVRVGDIVLFLYAGAYGWAISHHDFLSHPHPEHLYIGEDGQAFAYGGASRAERLG